MSTESTPRIMAAFVVAVLALFAASCGTPSNPVVPTGIPDSHEAIQPHGPGVRPTAPTGRVSGPQTAQAPNDENLPYRTPGNQPEDPGSVVVAPEIPAAPPAPPTLNTSDPEPTPTLSPSEQLPIPQVP